jgi:acyl-CoA thioester hydrolase
VGVVSRAAGGPVGRTRVRVRYGETDQQGVAYHAEYLVWMDVGRTTLLRELGFPYSRLEAEGLVFAVSEASCRYVGAARYEEEVEVETRVGKLQSRAVVFDYVLRVGERVVATGATTLVALDARRRPRRIPEPVARALAGHAP